MMKETLRKLSREKITHFSRMALAATVITISACSSDKDAYSQTLIPENTGHGIEDLSPPEIQNTIIPEIPITEIPTPIQSPEPNRADCNNISGTNYLSDLERDFYLKNCVKEPVLTPGIRQTQTSARPATGSAGAGQFTISGYYCKRVVGYPGYDSGGYCGNGASGLGTISGRTVACGSGWAFGTVFYIEGYGNVTCTDRGGAVGNNHLDIYFDTDHELHNTYFPKVTTVSVVK